MKFIPLVLIVVSLLLPTNPAVVNQALGQTLRAPVVLGQSSRPPTNSTTQEDVAEGKRVSGGRTKQGPEADWVPFAALGLMVFFFIALFGFKALKSRRTKPTTDKKDGP